MHLHCDFHAEGLPFNFFDVTFAQLLPQNSHTVLYPLAADHRVLDSSHLIIVETYSCSSLTILITVSQERDKTPTVIIYKHVL